MTYEEVDNAEVLLDDASKSYLCDLMAECSINHKLLAKTLFPIEFKHEFSPEHDKIFDLLDNSKAKKKGVAGPRGIGKSIIANLICAGDILFHRKSFVGYLSDSATKAEMETENIKTSLSTNETVRKLFPPVNATYYDDKSSNVYSKKSWIAHGHTFVLPRGAGQQVNGLRWLYHRPDRWLIDDLENVESVRSEMQRKKLFEWFFGPLSNTISEYEDDYDFFYIDTIKHEDALITHLMEDPEWEFVQVSVCDENYKTLIPTFMDQEKLDQKVSYYREKKIMDIFAREFMAKPVSGEDLSFGQLFQYYKETDPEFQKRIPHLINLVIIDPAKTAKMHNAQSGIVVWGVDIEGRAYYVREAVGAYLHPDELHSVALQKADQYNASAIGFEVTGLEEHLIYPFKNFMLSRGKKIYNIVELKARSGRGEFSGDGSKVGRITNGLLPLYRQGLVFHNQHATGPLEAQLLSFPFSARWDVMDAAAYLPQMLEKALMYLPPKDWEDKVEDDEYDMTDIYDEPKTKWIGAGYHSM